MPEIIIIGAGLTGLSTALHLQKPFLLLEKNRHPGGLCSSIEADGFTFDYSGHFLHLHTAEARSFMSRLMGKRLKEVKRNASVFTHRSLAPYPFQANLYYLPANIRKECLEGFYRRPSEKPFRAGMEFAAWSLATFGKGITRYFMRPYNEKLWTVSGRTLTADWVAPFVPRPSREEVEEGARRKKNTDFGYNVRFLYPAKGGCQAIVNALAGQVAAPHYGEEVVRIDCRRRSLVTSSGKTCHFDKLVSTQPLPELLKQMEGLPAEVKAAAAKLSWNSVSCVNLAFRSPLGPSSDTRHWIYFPEKKFIFYRAGIYTNVMPSMAPRGCSSLYVEISRRPDSPFPVSRALSRVSAGLREAGLTRKGQQAELVRVLDIPYAYVIYDKNRSAALSVIQGYLRKQGIFSIGRYGAWEYSFMERSLLDGKQTAELLSGKSRRKAPCKR